MLYYLFSLAIIYIWICLPDRHFFKHLALIFTMVCNIKLVMPYDLSPDAQAPIIFIMIIMLIRYLFDITPARNKRKDHTTGYQLQFHPGLYKFFQKWPMRRQYLYGSTYILLGISFICYL